MPGQMKHKLESRFLKEISITSETEELKSPLEESERKTRVKKLT